MNFLKKNKGLTLVELIVAIAISVIVFGSIISFLLVSTNLFKNSNTETNIQNEAQLTSNRLHDMLVDASAGVAYYVGSNVKVYNDTDDTAESKKLYIYDWDEDANGGSDNSKVTVYCITFDRAAKELQYSFYQYVADETEPTVESNILAQYVTDFKMQLYDPDSTTNTISSNQVKYQITFTLNDRSYKTESTVTLRNNVAVNRDLADVAVPVVPYVSTVTAVNVSPSSAQVVQGGSKKFEATVSGVNHPATDVTWQVKDNKDTTTTIDSDGTLHLGINETSQNMIVTATSVFDTTKVSTNSVVSASYMESAGLALKEGTYDAKARTVKATLSVSGFFLDQTVFDGQVVPANFKLTDAAGNAVSAAVSVEAADTSTKTYISWPITINYSGIADNSIINCSIKLNYPANITDGDHSKEASVSITVPATPAANPKIVAVRIARTDAAAHGTDTLWRGETGTYQVYVTREGQTETTISADGKCNCEWSIDLSRDYLELSGENTETTSVNVSKDSGKLPLAQAETFNLDVTVTDIDDEYDNSSASIKQDISKVTLTQTDKNSNYISYITSTNGYGGTIKKVADRVIVLKSEGIEFSDTSEALGYVVATKPLENYQITYRSNEYTVVYTTPTNSVSNKDVIIGIDTGTNIQLYNGAYATISLKYRLANVYGDDSKLVNYYIPIPDSGISYSAKTCDGTDYSVTYKKSSGKLVLSLDWKKYYSYTYWDNWYYS
jgi:prepilin-type N-terminal cleavage/methylation domain-containing protein